MSMFHRPTKKKEKKKDNKKYIGKGSEAMDARTEEKEWKGWSPWQVGGGPFRGGQRLGEKKSVSHTYIQGARKREKTGRQPEELGWPVKRLCVFFSSSPLPFHSSWSKITSFRFRDLFVGQRVPSNSSVYLMTTFFQHWEFWPQRVSGSAQSLAVDDDGHDDDLVGLRQLWPTFPHRDQDKRLFVCI